MLTEQSITTADIQDAAIDFPEVTQRQMACTDLYLGIKKWRIWAMLASQDIKLRYRRSILGPFWITISMAITVYSMGYLYSRLFHVDLQHYFPFLVAGMLGWSLISTMVTEYTDGFVTSDGLIKQVKLPYSLHIHRIIYRNIIIFFHNIIVIVPIIALFHDYAKINWYTLLLFPGLAVLYVNAMSYGMILAMLGARYRDIAQVIKSLIQVIFFITPVMWDPSMLSPKNQFIMSFNPFYGFLQIIRQPLLGQMPTKMTFIIVLFVSVFGIILSFLMFMRYRARIVYWL